MSLTLSYVQIVRIGIKLQIKLNLTDDQINEIVGHNTIPFLTKKIRSFIKRKQKQELEHKQYLKDTKVKYCMDCQNPFRVYKEDINTINDTDFCQDCHNRDNEDEC